MQFDIQAIDHPDAQAWGEHVRRRLQFGLTRFGESIRSVKVRMARASGADLVCHISVRFDDCAPTQVRETGPHPHAVIDRAADRVSRLAITRLTRARERFGAAHPELPQASRPAVVMPAGTTKKARRARA